MNLKEHLEILGACEPAKEWAKGKTAKETWEQCDNPSWLLWWASRTNVNSKEMIVFTAAQIARSVLKFVPKGEDRPKLAIEAAELWVKDPSAKNAGAAEWAARAAEWAAGAAGAAEWAACAAEWAARAAEWAARAAEWAARAAAVAAKNKEICDTIRANLSVPWLEE